MAPTFLAASAASAAAQGLQWDNLLVVVAVVVGGWPLYSRMRKSISRRRRERWAREEGWAQTTDEAGERR